MSESLCHLRLKAAGIVVGCIVTVLSAGIAIELWIALFHVSDRDASGTAITLDTIHLSIAKLAFAVLYFFSSLFLILGIVKECHLMLLPWLIHSAVFLIISFIRNLYNLLFATICDDVRISIAVFIRSLLALAAKIYIFRGINSLYKQIKLSNKQKYLSADQPQHVIDTEPNEAYKLSNAMEYTCT